MRYQSLSRLQESCGLSEYGVMDKVHLDLVRLCRMVAGSLIVSFAQSPLAAACALHSSRVHSLTCGTCDSSLEAARENDPLLI